jgi:hypothetical protein
MSGLTRNVNENVDRGAVVIEIGGFNTPNFREEWTIYFKDARRVPTHEYVESRNILNGGIAPLCSVFRTDVANYQWIRLFTFSGRSPASRLVFGKPNKPCCKPAELRQARPPGRDVPVGAKCNFWRTATIN